ncbi:MAG: ankyrin repeat domain-containing protein [candidate division Zixibacteria bacterium]
MSSVILFFTVIGLILINNTTAAPIHDAAAAGDIEKVKKLIEDNPTSAGSFDNVRLLPIHWAALNGHLEVVRLLIEQGTGVSAGDGDNTTPLICAVGRGHLDVVKYLIQQGASVDERDNYGNTPMLSATRSGSVEVVAYLAEHGGNLDEKTEHGSTLLLICISRNHPELARYLLERGADVNACPDPQSLPILRAVREGKTEIVEILLEFGAPVDYIEEKYGRSFLHLAAIKGDSAMAKLFIDHGADINKLDNAGKPPLFYALKYSHSTVVKFLKIKGAERDDGNAQMGNTNLLSCELKNKEAVVWYLGHSGWAVRTANHFLIFDYYIRDTQPDIPCLANGWIIPEEIKDLNVIVFSTHEHSDHYSSKIFVWKNDIPNISFVLGHKPNVDEDFLFTPPRSNHSIDDINIKTIASIDAGVGFVIEVDGLVIFHAGDHSNGKAEIDSDYTVEIDYLAELDLDIDLCFLPISGCQLGTPETVRKGVIYALEKLAPRAFFPQHLVHVEYLFREFVNDLHSNGFTVQAGCAENGGDSFLYCNQRLQ